VFGPPQGIPSRIRLSPIPPTGNPELYIGNVMQKSLVEFAPDLLLRPQIPVRFLRKLQFFYNPWNAKKFLVRYMEFGSKSQVFSEVFSG